MLIEAPARRAFYAIMLLALAARIATIFPYAIHHADEIGQYLAQAHRLLNGYGIVPWEYANDMRPWLFPLILAAPMALGAWIAPDTIAHLYLPKLLMVLLSLSIPVAAWLLGKRLSTAHALMAAFVAAIWCEIVYFASHTLTETASAAAILPAAAILLGRRSDDRRWLLLAGFLFGIAALMRFHYLPAIGIIALWGCWGQWRARLVPIIGGGLIAVLIGGIVDAAMGMTPYGWFINNFYQNVVLNRSAHFGVDGPAYYPMAVLGSWGVFTGLIAVLALIGGRRYPALLIAAIVNIVLHSMIGHKEYRFIMLSVNLLIILAALGSVDLVQFLRARYAVRSSALLFGAVSAFWIGGAVSRGIAMDGAWTRFQSSTQSMAIVGRDPKACGVAVNHYLVWITGVHAYLDRNVPIYGRLPVDPSKTGGPLTPASSRAFNTIIAADTERGDIDPAYRIKSCITAHGEETADVSRANMRKLCIYQRAGGCDGSADRHLAAQSAIDRYLAPPGTMKPD